MIKLIRQPWSIHWANPESSIQKEIYETDIEKKIGENHKKHLQPPMSLAQFADNIGGHRTPE